MEGDWTSVEDGTGEVAGERPAEGEKVPATPPLAVGLLLGEDAATRVAMDDFGEVGEEETIDGVVNCCCCWWRSKELLLG